MGTESEAHKCRGSETYVRSNTLVLERLGVVLYSMCQQLRVHSSQLVSLSVEAFILLEDIDNEQMNHVLLYQG